MLWLHRKSLAAARELPAFQEQQHSLSGRGVVVAVDSDGGDGDVGICLCFTSECLAAAREFLSPPRTTAQPVMTAGGGDNGGCRGSGCGGVLVVVVRLHESRQWS